jgi:hypothetical protein
MLSHHHICRISYTREQVEHTPIDDNTETIGRTRLVIPDTAQSPSDVFRPFQWPEPHSQG